MMFIIKKFRSFAYLMLIFSAFTINTNNAYADGWFVELGANYLLPITREYRPTPYRTNVFPETEDINFTSIKSSSFIKNIEPTVGLGYDYKNFTAIFFFSKNNYAFTGTTSDERIEKITLDHRIDQSVLGFEGAYSFRDILFNGLTFSTGINILLKRTDDRLNYTFKIREQYISQYQGFGSSLLIKYDETKMEPVIGLAVRLNYKVTNNIGFGINYGVSLLPNAEYKLNSAFDLTVNTEIGQLVANRVITQSIGFNLRYYFEDVLEY